MPESEPATMAAMQEIADWLAMSQSVTTAKVREPAP